MSKKEIKTKPHKSNEIDSEDEQRPSTKEKQTKNRNANK